MVLFSNLKKQIKSVGEKQKKENRRVAGEAACALYRPLVSKLNCFRHIFFYSFKHIVENVTQYDHFFCCSHCLYLM